MKFLNKLLILVLVLGVASCNMTDLNLQDNPNAVSPDKANPNDLFNSIQLNVASFFQGTWGFTGGVTRMRHWGGGFTYNDAFRAQNFDGLWTTAYAGVFPDVDALVALAEERGLDVHAGMAKILKAYVMMTLVDLFGDVPYSEAGQGTDVISPQADPGAEVYAAAEALLDEAIAQLEATEAAPPAADLFYDGDVAKWITAAKTLKLRMAVTTRLVDPQGAAAKINKIVGDGDFIDDNSEDFQFHYSTNRLNPDSRHPFYSNSYESNDGTYMANYYMWLLAYEKLDADGNPVTDPRIRWYFYRQTSDAFAQDQNVYSCIFSEFPDQDKKPDHYIQVDPRLPYCVLEMGYYGRDHLNGSGIPPDGPIRTVYGLYPGGGMFDDNQFTYTQQQGELGARGAGIAPILLASYVDFMRAEAALTIGTNDDARALLESGIRKSMAKVMSFTSPQFSQTVKIGINEGTVQELLVDPAMAKVDDYVAYVLDQYDNAADDTERLNIVMKEYLIALWGNGIEAYNAYRRTGMPLKIQPTIEPASFKPDGSLFTYSALYPSVYVNRNQNATQKNITDRVWWDDGSAKLY